MLSLLRVSINYECYVHVYNNICTSYYLFFKDLFHYLFEREGLVKIQQVFLNANYQGIDGIINMMHGDDNFNIFL